MWQFKIQQSNTLAPTGVSVMNRRAFVAALKDMQAKIVLSRVSTSELGLNFMFILQQYGPDSNCYVACGSSNSSKQIHIGSIWSNLMKQLVLADTLTAV